MNILDVAYLVECLGRGFLAGGIIINIFSLCRRINELEKN